ncbi:nucleoid-associated protein [Escherichia coli]
MNWRRRCAYSVRRRGLSGIRRTATGRLRDELAKYPFADGGFVLFCHYRIWRWSICWWQLSNLSSMRVNENLDINPTHYLDINHADIVARIDLTEWETNAESTRYLAFLKGRVGRKVADFFMDFLGASEGLNAKRKTVGCCKRLMISLPSTTG